MPPVEATGPLAFYVAYSKRNSPRFSRPPLTRSISSSSTVRTSLLDSLTRTSHLFKAALGPRVLRVRWLTPHYATGPLIDRFEARLREVVSFGQPFGFVLAIACCGFFGLSSSQGDLLS